MAVPHNGKLRYGQQLVRNAPLGIPVRLFTEQVMDDISAFVLYGTSNVEIIPGQNQDSTVRTFTDLSNAYSLIAPIKVTGTFNMSRDQLPDTLVSVGVTYNESEQLGVDYSEAPTAAGIGNSGSSSLTASANAQSGASSIPALTPIIKVTPGSGLPVTNVFFYKNGNITVASLITSVETAFSVFGSIAAGIFVGLADHGLVVGQRVIFTSAGTYANFTLNTVYWVVAIPLSTRFTFSATNGGAAITTATAVTATFAPKVYQWPLFFPVSHTLVCHGQQVSLRQNASSKQQASWDSTSQFSYELLPYNGKRSDGYSKEVALTTTTHTISPTIHALITLSSTGTTKVAGTLVKANIPAMYYSGTNTAFKNFNGGSLPAITNEPTAQALSATSLINPSSLAATTPTSIPSSGLYIVELQTNFVDADANGTIISFVHAVVIDASIFA